MIIESLKVIEDLKRRPQLVLMGDVGFYSIKTFVIGYIQGLGVALNYDMHKGLSIWFKSKVKEDCSLFWSEHITNYYEGVPESELILHFLNNVEDFLKEFNSN